MDVLDEDIAPEIFLCRQPRIRPAFFSLLEKAEFKIADLGSLTCSMPVAVADLELLVLSRMRYILLFPTVLRAAVV